MDSIIFSNSEIAGMSIDLHDTSAMFNARFEEAYNYIQYLKTIESSSIEIDGELQRIDRDYVKVSRANSYVILYNLIESTVVELTKGLFKNLSSAITDVDDLIDNIKKIIFKNIKNSKNEDYKFLESNLDKNFSAVISEICFHEKRLENLFSGNIDGKKLREFTHDFGIELRLNEQSNNGGNLLEVKRTRNDLAHGSVSFSEKGDKNADYLFKICIAIGHYLRGLISSVNEFIQQQLYLKA